MAFSVEVNLKDSATPALTNLALAFAGEKLAAAAGQPVLQLVRSRFFRLDRERKNKLGGPRKHFFGEAARSTNLRVTSSSAVVSVSHQGIRQRFQGGVIRPTGGRRYLTIPATAAAYGTRAGEWDNLKFGFAFNSRGEVRPALIEAQQTSLKFGKKKRKDGRVGVKRTIQEGGKAVFWLVRSVNQPPDPAIIPSPEEIRAAAMDGVRKYFAAAVKRGAGR